MNPASSILSVLILAVVQGLTEFLPISSSGHLVLIRELFGWSDDGGLLLDIVLHAGSLMAILIYFWRTWRDMLAAWRSPDKTSHSELRWLPALLLLATLPIIVVGAPLKSLLETPVFRNGIAVGLGMMATALLLWFCDLCATPAPRPTGVRQALFAGLMQVVALLPGVSRSGWTTAGSLFAGQTREKAVRFAFLMAIPAIGCAMGAQLLNLLKGKPLAQPVWLLLFGFFVSFVVSLGAIHFCLLFFRRYTLRAFSPYLAVAGLLAFLLTLARSPLTEGMF